MKTTTPPRAPALSVPNPSNLLGYLSVSAPHVRAARAGVAVLTALVLGAVAQAGSCCKPAPGATPTPPAKDACCAAPRAAAETFTRESLYQADGTFTTDAGRPFRLAELRGRPVVVNLFFATCGYACPLTVTDLLALQARLSPELRRDTVFVLVTFDPVRDTAAALAQYRAARQLDGNWILLRGDDASVRELAALVGVKYKQEADGSFAHSNLFTVLNREGEIVHQRTGLKGGLDEALAAIHALR
jgi:protein SCO1/2